MSGSANDEQLPDSELPADGDWIGATSDEPDDSSRETSVTALEWSREPKTR